MAYNIKDLIEVEYGFMRATYVVESIEYGKYRLRLRHALMVSNDVIFSTIITVDEEWLAEHKCKFVKVSNPESLYLNINLNISDLKIGTWLEWEFAVGKFVYYVVYYVNEIDEQYGLKIIKDTHPSKSWWTQPGVIRFPAMCILKEMKIIKKPKLCEHCL